MSRVYLILVKMLVYQYLNKGALNQPLLPISQNEGRTHSGARKGLHLLDHIKPLTCRIASFGLLFLADSQDIIWSDRKRGGNALSPIGVQSNSQQHQKGVDEFIAEQIQRRQNLLPGFLPARLKGNAYMPSALWQDLTIFCKKRQLMFRVMF